MIYKKRIFAALFFTVLTSQMYSQESFEADGYLSNPAFSSDGIIFTDNYGSALYQFSDNKITELVTGPNCGKYFSVSPSKTKVGVKLITANGKQVPAVINLSDGVVSRLTEEADFAGQPTFSRKGDICFSLGNHLIVRTGENEKRFDLGVYSNLTPISPDGNRAAYNDIDDHILIINLNSGDRKLISSGNYGYYFPVWSPNSRYLIYSSLGGTLFLFDLNSNKTISIGEGLAPSWNSTSRGIVFHKAEYFEERLAGSDLYYYDVQKNTTVKLTDTPEIFEMEPAFSEDGEEILYHNYLGRSIFSVPFSADQYKSDPRLIFDGVELKPLHYHTVPPDVSGKALSMSYVHQVYDTPDWHNGHWSCAPTAAITVLGYYKILPRWEIRCSTPYPGHYNQWGRYVADKYRFMDYLYQSAANDPNSNAAWGGYGYMWNGGSPHTKMAGYYRKHGLNAIQSESPPYSEALGEIESGYPYTMCVMLTSSGHLIVAHGLYTDHTLIFNDPYGNKNTPGYPSYDGKNAMYDWPGYNNGFQNLNGVAWCIRHRYDIPAQADTLVDDSHLERGFYLHTKTPASMTTWRDKALGHKNHFWYVFTNASGTTDTSYATWTPALPQDGQYEVFAYIPFSNAVDARYKIHHLGGQTEISLNQKNFNDQWASLGLYNFAAGSGLVYLGDASSVAGQEIIFDAIKWEFRGPVTGITEKNNPEKFNLLPAYPNPFNPSTNISFEVPEAGRAVLKVYNSIGELVAVPLDSFIPKGLHNIKFYAGGLSGGLYIYELRAGTSVARGKALLLK
ncbi:MAG: hypothetical protein K9I69_07130 [Ignavibacteriales bacterium]|nr:hypothetical protein [Ignavibacteriales bacterium]MCF8316561.1 hypothetical protein [Ignavibacteriales bacterium]MCF8437484.1 hypothetical protein [Ignavibacteriales bacterium]